jgi:translation initiation factor 3 subunit I
LWNCQTGECIETFNHRGPVRGVAWSEDNRKFATISDPFVEHNAKISIYDIDSGDTTPILEIDIPKEVKKINPTNISWTALNEHLFVSMDNGYIRLYSPETGKMVKEFMAHEKKINRVQFNREKTLFITSSADFTSKLYDAVYLKHLKTYKTDRPINDAVISETKDHVLLGGGQDAMSVTTTSGKVGKFETRFFHLVYEEEFGCVKGHFGPINACTFLSLLIYFLFSLYDDVLEPVVGCLLASIVSLLISHANLFLYRLQWQLVPTAQIMPVVPKMVTCDYTFSTRAIWI